MSTTTITWVRASGNPFYDPDTDNPGPTRLVMTDDGMIISADPVFVPGETASEDAWWWVDATDPSGEPITGFGYENPVRWLSEQSLEDIAGMMDDDEI